MIKDLPNDIIYRIRSFFFQEKFRFFEQDHIAKDTNSTANLNELYSLFKTWIKTEMRGHCLIPEKCELDDYLKERYSKSNLNEFNNIRIKYPSIYASQIVFTIFENEYIAKDTNSTANLNELYSLFKTWYKKEFNVHITPKMYEHVLPKKCELDDYLKKRYSKSNLNEFNGIRIRI